MPELSSLVGIWCALMSTFQGVGAIYGLVDAHKKKQLEIGGAPVLTKFNPLFVSIVLFIGMVLTTAVSTWMFVAKPLRPTIRTIEKTVYVDRYLPCPPTKTGPATARSGSGGTSVAHSGSNDSYNVPSSSKPPK